MPQYEYKVVPAPAKGQKARGIKTPQARFALSVETVLNEMGAQGWEYLRAELLPSDERTGLTGSTTNWRNVLVFRRAIDTVEDEVATPQFNTAPIAAPVSVAVPAPSVNSPEPSETPRLASGAERILKDNGVEELSDVSGMTESLKSRAERQGDEAEDETDEAQREATEEEKVVRELFRPKDRS